MASNKISVYSLPDLKNTTDDAIPNYLNSIKFKQSHFLTDVRLALGYSMLAIAAACFAWDFKLGFDDTKLYTTLAVGLYTILNAVFTVWIWIVEKGQIYVGTSPRGEKISISSSTTKNSPIYTLTVTYTPASKPTSKPITITLSPSFATWFDAAGHFVALPLQKLLASSIPPIGEADPGRAVAALADNNGAGAGQSRIPDDVILQALEDLGAGAQADVGAASGSGTGSEVKTTSASTTSAGAKKGKGRRKA